MEISDERIAELKQQNQHGGTVAYLDQREVLALIARLVGECDKRDKEIARLREALERIRDYRTPGEWEAREPIEMHEQGYRAGVIVAHKTCAGWAREALTPAKASEPEVKRASVECPGCEGHPDDEGTLIDCTLCTDVGRIPVWPASAGGVTAVECEGGSGGFRVGERVAGPEIGAGGEVLAVTDTHVVVRIEDVPEPETQICRWCDGNGRVPMYDEQSSKIDGAPT